ncbi:MAG: regulatory protein RecX [Pseudomonadales bacterium]|nr:regulatory protein RecX [Pseudomonadales bacterium]
MTRTPEEIRPADIRRAAMDYLARREHSRRELLEKLKARFDAGPELIQQEVDRLREEGLQSDARLAEALVQARVNRGQGPLKIRAELRGKGVDDDVIEVALDECMVDWTELVAEVARKRFGDRPPADAKARAKRIRFLQQRGFSFDHINTLN